MNKSTRTTSLRQHKLTFLKDPTITNLQQTRSQSFKQGLNISPEKKEYTSTKQNNVFFNGGLPTRPKSKYGAVNTTSSRLFDSQKSFLLSQVQQQKNIPSPTLHKKHLSDKSLPKLSPVKSRLGFKIENTHQLGLFKRDHQNIIKSIHSKSQAGKNEDNITKTNQDSLISIQQFHDDIALFGVCDGHGQDGHKCSQFIRDTLPKQIAQAMPLSQIQDALTKAFLKTNTLLCNNDEIISTFSGSTTVISLIVNRTIITANIGDSRSIICRKLQNGNLIPVPLSNDHKPDLPSEQKRIEQTGGRVQPYIDFDGTFLGPARVWMKEADVPGLAMSRSFGDKIAASCGVISDPEILQHQIQDGDLFMVIASDGIWEFLSNDDVIEMIYPYYNSEEGQQACSKLVKEATKLWKQNDSVIDDITIIIVFFNRS